MGGRKVEGGCDSQGEVEGRLCDSLGEGGNWRGEGKGRGTVTA